MSAYTAKFRLGEIQFEITADSEREIFERATVFGEIPRQCVKCESQRLWPRHRTAQGRYHYYEVVCLECGQRCKVGQTQESGSFFCRGEWEAPFQPSADDGRENARHETRHETGRQQTQAAPRTADSDDPSVADHAAAIDARRNEMYASGERSYPPSGGQGKPYGKR